MNSGNKLAGIGLLTAISASLCCITPVLALLAGTAGVASAFTWMDPLRPYMIGATVLILGMAWYQKLKPQKQTGCDCGPAVETPFIRSKKFLGLVTVFTGITLLFPMYAPIFYPKTESTTIVTTPTNIRTTKFSITGMTCAGCEEHIAHEVNKLKGILKATASYENGNAIIVFDQAQTNLTEIKQAIKNTGYSITSTEEIK